MKQINIHFVCRGNIYRSRIAEMYAKSLGHKNILFSSSGIVAADYSVNNKSVSPLALYIAKRHRLKTQDSLHRTQTTNTLLSKSDLIIFMQDDIYKDAARKFSFHGLKSKAWRVQDWDEAARAQQLSLEDASVQHDLAEQAFIKIKKQVDKLIEEVTTVSWVDVVDVDNVDLKLRLPVSWANASSEAWHRACHAILTTPSGVVVEKRSDSIFFSPGLLDMSVGGAVDAGEKPKDALLREISEELGVKVPGNRARLIEVRRWSTYHPRFKKYTRTHLYSYHVHFDHDPHFVIQSNELSSVHTLSLRQTKRLLRLHRLKGLGRLNYAYRYYAKMLKLTDLI